MSPCIHPPHPEHFGLPPHGESHPAHDAPAAGGNATVSHDAGIAEAMATLRRACAGERPGRPGGSVAPKLPPPDTEREGGCGQMGWRQFVVTLLVLGYVIGYLVAAVSGQ